MNTSLKVLFLITFGLSIRLILAFLPGFNIDVNDWYTWSVRLSNFNFNQFYSKDVFTDYTPGYLYVLSLLGFLKNLLALPDNFFYLVLKIPAIISEIIIGLLIYKQIRRRSSEKIALFSLSVILFNFALIFNSSVWGQIDSILALFMLITVISLKKNNLILTSILFGLTLLIKPQALALIPLLIIFIVGCFKISSLFKIIVPGFLIIFVLTFPFFPNHTILYLAQHIANTAGEYPYTSINAYNLWGILGFWIDDNQLWNGISYQGWGYILLIGYWILVGYFYLKKKLSIYALATLVTLGFFFLPTRVHERYLYPGIVFLILLAIINKSKLLMALTGILSSVHLLNLYYVYVYYNEFYLKLPKMLYYPLLYNYISSSSKILSLVSVVIFILISTLILKYDISSKKA